MSQLVYLNNSVLLPNIEYRLQTTFLSKSVCDKLQRPIWVLTKNKLDLASTTANAICSHNGFLGLCSIWQNQLAHHFTELTIRLNRQDDLGRITRIRLKEGQLQSKNLSCPTSKKFNFDRTVPKHNLTYKVLHEAAKIGLRINELVENSNRLDFTGTEIYNLLEKKEAQSFATTDRLNLFILEQVLDSSGRFLLTWQQIKHIRASQRKGRTPSWFTKLEKKVLKEEN